MGHSFINNIGLRSAVAYSITSTAVLPEPSVVPQELTAHPISIPVAELNTLYLTDLASSDSTMLETINPSTLCIYVLKFQE